MKFKSNWNCSCKMKFGDHVVVCETREERVGRGKVVKELEGDRSLKLNGVNDFVDLVEYGDRFEAKVDEYNENVKVDVGKVNALELYNMPHEY